ncbi:MAG: rod shape-determining protein RodA [Peptococcaceae bacterium]|jgi:rod shape determining protein RodA|nr:rod shape-determining protein RodA [Peptococcaceae bacterium]
MVFQRILKRLDYYLLASVTVILGFGLVIIASATHQGRYPYAFVEKQVIWIAVGIVVMAFFLYLDYGVLMRYERYLYVFNLLMLASVFLVGRSNLGAQRWIPLGPFQFQPSEFAKVIYIVTFASFLSRRVDNLKRFRDLLLPLAYMLVPMVLIIKQPDLGTALVFLAVTFGMLFMAGARPLTITALIIGGLVLVVGGIWAHLRFGVPLPLLKGYQISRLTIFLNPWSDWRGAGYNIIQSQIALGSGGLFGKGLFAGSQSQLNFLPIQYADFIFSVVGEELGFVGAVVLLSLYFLVLYRGIRITSLAKDNFGMLLAAGVVSLLFFHVLVNVGAVSGVMPVTGIPLPFFSYGGSAVMTDLAALGLLMAVHVQRQKIMF